MRTDSDVKHVSALVERLVTTMLEVHRNGMSSEQVSDIALSVYLSLVVTFDQEDYAIAALPTVRGLLEQAKMRRPATAVLN